MSFNLGRRFSEARKQTASPGRGNSREMLVNVMQFLTPDVSDDQRELEKTRLEKGLRDTEAVINQHENDVQECLDAFKDVSTEISSCRKLIYKVRNSLHTCEALLDNQRNDLKLWIENAQK